MSYKTLDRSDIESAFEDLLAAGNQTTSLNVKEELRDRGFWATQGEVGVAVREIADDLGIDWDYNGVYRTYYAPGTHMSPTSGAWNQIGPGAYVKAPASLAKQKTPPASPADREPIKNPTSGDWIAWDINDPNSPLYFIGKLTATQARYAFTLATGANYVDVRNIRF